ncbi:hypothetical protein [Geobacter pickeringii]|uniref:hypothetical protein n=1 Tax=Geobacter pickeringii TaxID=345632 RepID=UPI001F32654B|nr:hypothetical protein [Geobacter pickeringii]
MSPSARVAGSLEGEGRMRDGRGSGAVAEGEFPSWARPLSQRPASLIWTGAPELADFDRAKMMRGSSVT